MNTLKIKTNLSKLILLFLALSFVISSCEETESGETANTNSDVDYSYPLIATGQTTLYDNDGEVINSLNESDALYGQDANYLKGATMSYTNNGDGTITDNSTGLMWEEIPVPDGLTYDNAVAYCDSLVLAGYNDWRIPSAKELFSISDFGKGWPYLDTTYFKLATGIVDKSEQFWTSNRYVGVTTEGQDNAAFGVNHVTGHIKAYPASAGIPGGGGAVDSTGTNPPSDSTGINSPPPNGGVVNTNPLAKHVRAVRGTEYGINKFVDNGDETITDNATGLMWAQEDSGEGIDWEAALTYAENSTLAGYTDWRLPNVKELQSIVDYRFAPGATDAANEGAAIDPDFFTCTPIVNEAGNSDYPYYWTSTSARFSLGQPYYYAWYVAFGRAVDNSGEDSHGAGAVRFDTKYDGGPLGEGGERFYNFVRLVRDVN